VVGADDPKPVGLGPLDRELDGLVQHNHARRVVAVDDGTQAGLFLYDGLLGLGIPAMW
jgi:hypothetical protein